MLWSTFLTFFLHPSQWMDTRSTVVCKHKSRASGQVRCVYKQAQAKRPPSLPTQKQMLALAHRVLQRLCFPRRHGEPRG